MNYRSFENIFLLGAFGVSLTYVSTRFLRRFVFGTLAQVCLKKHCIKWAFWFRRWQL